MDKEKVIDLILNDKYYTIDDLRYNRKIGLLFSNKDFENYLKIKDDLVLNGFDYICKLPLKTFNSKNCFYVKSSYLINNLVEYKRILLSDFELNQSYLYDRNIEDIMYSRLFSELEGSLNIESINTTYSHILKISKSDIIFLLFIPLTSQKLIYLIIAQKSVLVNDTSTLLTNYLLYQQKHLTLNFQPLHSNQIHIF